VWVNRFSCESDVIRAFFGVSRHKEEIHRTATTRVRETTRSPGIGAAR
tara:strand:- start:2756 stop:2899 length:144 start_codon:yes stop_codon:yes gene_type:complete